MNSRTILLLSLALIAASPASSAQSLRESLKKAAEKVGKQVEQEVSKKIPVKTGKTAKRSGNSSARNAELEKQYEAMLGPGVGNAEDEAPTVRLPETHTALFAPLGYPIEAAWGVKKAKPQLPPKAAAKQVDWVDKLPSIYDLDNQSLIDEYLLLDQCKEDGYIQNLTPAMSRYDNVIGEVIARADALNGMVEQYNEAKGEYDSETYQWVINGIHRKSGAILESREYKTVIRTSLTPFFTLKGDFINDETKKYFAAHGGYENAINVTMTAWDPQPDKKSIGTSEEGQSGKVVDENASGATVDIGGIIYVLHNTNNGRAGRAFISEVYKTAVAGKDIVIPDYVNYNGKKYPVKEMRADLFRGTSIKSVKLPATLPEISNAAFRETPITEIVIPASVEKIQGSAFYGCKNLTKVVFESDTMEELHGCFQKCTSLKSVKFPRRVGLMSYDMFEGCTNLTEVILPENLKEIYSSMFQGCKKLTRLDVPPTVTKVGMHAFGDSGITELDLSHVKEFEGFCFSGCKALKTVKLNSSLKEDFLMETYDEFMECPLLEVKYINNEYVFPAGFIFVDTD